MKLANRLIWTFIFMTLAFNSYGIGLGDWTCKTPEGNEIINTGGIFLNMQNGQVLEGLDRWYFYKGNIIGQRHNDNNRNKSYFVVNENTHTIDTFRTERAWSAFIKRHDLKPAVWTRWYNGDWQIFDDDILFLAIVFFYISIPLFLLFVWLCYKAVRQESLNFKRPYTLMLTIIAGLILSSLLLEQFPQSV